MTSIQASKVQFGASNSTAKKANDIGNAHLATAGVGGALGGLGLLTTDNPDVNRFNGIDVFHVSDRFKPSENETTQAAAAASAQETVPAPEAQEATPEPESATAEAETPEAQETEPPAPDTSDSLAVPQEVPTNETALETVVTTASDHYVTPRFQITDAPDWALKVVSDMGDGVAEQTNEVQQRTLAYLGKAWNGDQESLRQLPSNLKTGSTDLVESANQKMSNTLAKVQELSSDLKTEYTDLVESANQKMSNTLAKVQELPSDLKTEYTDLVESANQKMLDTLPRVQEGLNSLANQSDMRHKNDAKEIFEHISEGTPIASNQPPTDEQIHSTSQTSSEPSGARLNRPIVEGDTIHSFSDFNSASPEETAFKPASVLESPDTPAAVDHDGHDWHHTLEHLFANSADIAHDASPFVLIPSAIAGVMGLLAKAAGFGAQTLNASQKATIAHLDALG